MTSIQKCKVAITGAGAVKITFAFAFALILRWLAAYHVVSTLPGSEYGINGVCLSVPCVLCVPCVVAKSGVNRILSAALSAPFSVDDLSGLQAPAKILREHLEALA